MHILHGAGEIATNRLKAETWSKAFGKWGVWNGKCWEIETRATAATGKDIFFPGWMSIRRNYSVVDYLFELEIIRLVRCKKVGGNLDGSLRIKAAIHIDTVAGTGRPGKIGNGIHVQTYSAMFLQIISSQQQQQSSRFNPNINHLSAYYNSFQKEIRFRV